MTVYPFDNTILIDNKKAIAVESEGKLIQWAGRRSLHILPFSVELSPMAWA